MGKRDNEVVTLGSGELYLAEYAGSIPADATLEASANLLGHISGGASLEYKPGFYTAKDDLGKVSKTRITEEEVTLKSGIMTWNGNTLSKLAATGRVTENTETGKRTLKIGGLGQDNGKEYVLRFLHKDAIDGDLRVTIVGKNKSGFSLAFAKDKETVVDAEFTANPSIDSDGTLVIIEEDIDVVQG